MFNKNYLPFKVDVDCYCWNLLGFSSFTINNNLKIGLVFSPLSMKHKCDFSQLFIVQIHKFGDSQILCKNLILSKIWYYHEDTLQELVFSKFWSFHKGFFPTICTSKIWYFPKFDIFQKLILSKTWNLSHVENLKNG